MAICNPDCTITPPASYSGNCGIITKDGGIDRLIFLTCDTDTTGLDYTEQSTWDALCLAGQLATSGKLVAEKPKGSFTKKKVSSCGPEVVTGGEKTINFQDYNQEANNGTGEFEFWNTICADPTKFFFIYVTCDGWLYGPIKDFGIEVDEVIPNDSKEERYIDGSITYDGKCMDVPVYIGTSLELECEESSSIVLV